MPEIRVTKPFIHKGRKVEPGTVMTVPDHALKVLGDYVEPVDLHRLVGEALAEVDRQGRPWPSRFVSSLPAEDRDRLRELERSIDAAVLNGDSATLPSLLTEWRRLLLSRLH